MSFEDLARSSNSMAEALRENIEKLSRITAEKGTLPKVLDIARSIQTSFLPEKMPEDLRFWTSSLMMIPAMEVGGDFYDIIPAGDVEKWAFVIADVSVKGVSAALFMAMSRTLLRAGFLEATPDPSNCSVLYSE